MRRFVLIRRADVSGVSGTGLVAEGVEFTDGRVSTRWLPPAGGPAQTCAWDRVEDVIAVHGHGGLTELRWLDPPPGSPPTPATTVIPVSPPTSVLDQPPGAGPPLFDELLRPPPAA